MSIRHDHARRLIRYAEGNAARLGVMNGDDQFAALSPDAMTIGELLALAPEDRDARVAAALDSAPARPIDKVALLPLVDDAATIWAIALNYDSHISEGAHQRPAYPMMFLRLPRSFAAPGAALLKPGQTRQFDYEGELAVYVGRGGSDIPRGAAMAHIGGFACANEGSVREWQKHTSQITPGKNFWRSGALGPAIRLVGDGYDPLAARLTTRVNDREVQAATVGEMLFGIDEVIAYVSTIAPLAPGDVILMGTPGGVGFRRDPQLFLDLGDTVDVTIDGLGTLTNPVAARTAHG